MSSNEANVVTNETSMPLSTNTGESAPSASTADANKVAADTQASTSVATASESANADKSAPSAAAGTDESTANTSASAANESATNASTNDERSLRYAQKLAKLIQIPTISYSGQGDADRFREFHKVLSDTFPHLFNVCKIEDFEGSLLLRWPGKKPSALPVLFMNHMDVVEPNGKWGAHEPFSGDIADGKLWGRGTLDTKSGLFGMLQAADELAESGFTPSCDIYFVSTCTEETEGTGADNITRALQERNIRFRFTLDEGGYILHDPLGGADGDFAMIGVGEKSLATLKFTASDQGGHASTPGKNTALVQLGKFMVAADRAAKRGSIFKVHLHPTIVQTLKSMAPVMSGPLKVIFNRANVFKPLLQLAMPHISGTAAALTRTTIAFTMAGGSDAYNVLPTQAWVIANMRCSHHQGIEASVAAITKLAHRYKLNVEVIEWEPDSPISNYNAEGFSLLTEALKRAYPSVIAAPYIMTGLSDSRFMSRVSDTCLRLVPYFVSNEQVETIHGIDENIDVSTLAPGVDVYKYLMQRV